MAVVKRSFKVEGFRELDATLGTLSKGVARNALRKALVKGGQPIADRMAELAPKETLELSQSMTISTKIKNMVGNAEYAAAMRAGLGKVAAAAAMRTARRNSGKGSFAEVHVGPSQAKNKDDAIKRIVQEFGSFNQPGTPYARPAWAEKQNEALEIIKTEMVVEVNKAVARAIKRNMKKVSP